MLEKEKRILRVPQQAINGRAGHHESEGSGDVCGRAEPGCTAYAAFLPGLSLATDAAIAAREPRFFRRVNTGYAQFGAFIMQGKPVVFTQVFA